MKRAILKTLKIMLWIIASLIVLFASLIVLNEVLSGHDNLAYGIQRISNLTSYPLTEEKSSLILHKSNQSDSIVMVHDCRLPDEMQRIMEQLVATDNRWKPVKIAQKDAYHEVVMHLAWGFQEYEHFRPICDIGNGEYDYIFVDNPQKRDTVISLVDVETATIILYIYLH